MHSDVRQSKAKYHLETPPERNRTLSWAYTFSYEGACAAVMRHIHSLVYIHIYTQAYIKTQIL